MQLWEPWQHVQWNLEWTLRESWGNLERTVKEPWGNLDNLTVGTLGNLENLYNATLGTLRTCTMQLWEPWQHVQWNLEWTLREPWRNLEGTVRIQPWQPWGSDEALFWQSKRCEKCKKGAKGLFSLTWLCLHGVWWPAGHCKGRSRDPLLIPFDNEKALVGEWLMCRQGPKAQTEWLEWNSQTESLQSNLGNLEESFTI